MKGQENKNDPCLQNYLMNGIFKMKDVYIYFVFICYFALKHCFMYGDRDCNKNHAYKMPFIQVPFMQLKSYVHKISP